MGQIYQHIEKFVRATPHGLFVEIGSDRWEGSTTCLDNLAQKHNTKLISVDIVPDAQRRLQHSCPNTEFVVGIGSKWSADFASNNPEISVLYLDNFDYIWDVNSISPEIEKQILEYSRRGIKMTNENCQTEHLAQLLELYPCLVRDAVVAFDDTYCDNGCWVGKCGPAVVYLLAKGWKVVHQTLDCGVILTKA